MKTLLVLTISGSALALLLLALRYLFLKRMPSTVYYYAWLLVLLRFALPLPGLVPDWSAAESTQREPVHETARLTEAEIEPETELPGFEAPIWAEAAEAVTDEAPIPAPDLPQQESPAQTDGQTSAVRTTARFDVKDPALWLWVWAFGTLISLSMPVAAYLRFSRALGKTLRAPEKAIRHQYAAIPGKKPPLFISRAVKTPLTLGLFSPRIILPAGLSEGETLQNVLRHELTHVRRHDTLYKWLALAVFSAHWFNPLTYLFRRELDRACELSCDEALLGSMTREEKRAYGNTLLQMAASGALPTGVVATTFATEKKNLKERLEQIMTYRKGSARVLAAVLALALLAGCGVIAGPAAENASPADPPADVPESAPSEKPVSARPTPEGGVAEVHVSNVEELLDAIAPNTVIVLAKGDYDLSTAENYGKKPEGAYYDWNNNPSANLEGEKHFELVITGVDNLTFRGEDPEETRILARPRYANVIRFVNCQFPVLEALTAGHTDGAYCKGGVLRFESCGNVTVCNCGLFGCGTIGVWAQSCDGVYVINSRIYECSDAAVCVEGCREVIVEDCDIYDHGLRSPNTTARSLLEASDTDGFVIYKNRISDSAMQYLLNCSRVRNAFFLSNEVSDNRIESSVFAFQQYPCVVDGCFFMGNTSSVNDGVPLWVLNHALDPIDTEGKALDAAALESMTLSDSDPNMPFPSVAIEAAAEVSRGASITVKTVDEFLKAIGPDRTIILDGALFDLSTASNYGKTGTEYYYWNESYDGPELVIQNVSGLSILAFSDDAAATTISATPRYADVLTFKSCSELDLVGFTAGHTKEPGSCSGGVLNLNNCHGVRIDRCRLYGCGILGLETHECTGISLKETEIFECSQGAGRFYDTDGITFTDCDVHDVPSPHFFSQHCGDMSWNGEPMQDAARIDVGEDGKLTSSYQGTTAINEHLTGVPLDSVSNPFANEPARSFEPGSAMEGFASVVQHYIREGDLDALADCCAYPLTVFLGDYSMVIESREEFMHWLADGSFLRLTFTEDWMQRIGKAELTEYAQCGFGSTVLDHSVAVSVVRAPAGTGGAPTEEDYAITCISFAGPLWPGQADPKN